MSKEKKDRPMEGYGPSPSRQSPRLSLMPAVSLKPVKSGGNLLLFTPYDDGVFYGSTRFNDIQVASEIQIYLDLQGFRGRGEEAAKMLYDRIVEKAW